LQDVTGGPAVVVTGDPVVAVATVDAVGPAGALKPVVARPAADEPRVVDEVIAATGVHDVGRSADEIIRPLSADDGRSLAEAERRGGLHGGYGGGERRQGREA